MHQQNTWLPQSRVVLQAGVGRRSLTEKCQERDDEPKKVQEG